MRNIQAEHTAKMLQNLQDSFKEHGTNLRKWEWDFKSLPPVVIALGRAYNAVLTLYDLKVGKKKSDLKARKAAKNENGLKKKMERKVENHETINVVLVMI